MIESGKLVGSLALIVVAKDFFLCYALDKSEYHR